MKRRTFLQSTLAASCLPLVTPRRGSAADDVSDRQLLDWRQYRINNDTQHEMVSTFLRTALVPALQRLEVGPVGVFTEMGDDASKSIYLLAPFDSFGQRLDVDEALAADQTFLGAATDYLSTDKATPAYERIDSQLMWAFRGYPRVKTPRSGPGIFELRTYESHSELKAKQKIEMFNEAELDIFRKVGLDGVFFGETLVGTNLPKLTYMLAYKDMDEHDRAWDAFRDHPDWHALRDREQYQDTVSKIINRFLEPTEYSQI